MFAHYNCMLPIMDQISKYIRIASSIFARESLSSSFPAAEVNLAWETVRIC